ncbi:MAG: hypothetical protein BJ554DRAFT_7405 [Olpidium bornovanus]|uniref:Uncharacterized protein n=1 Tax=Olpidium bornovanus TaxID=278681 RepID=A0A8H8DJG3_9FUNG|nr:MAG: hypothetical protein BJ554DRAFT_7405 [Olpidium bornovanus]
MAKRTAKQATRAAEPSAPLAKLVTASTRIMPLIAVQTMTNKIGRAIGALNGRGASGLFHRRRTRAKLEAM